MAQSSKYKVNKNSYFVRNEKKCNFVRLFPVLRDIATRKQTDF